MVLFHYHYATETQLMFIRHLGQATLHMHVCACVYAYANTVCVCVCVYTYTYTLHAHHIHTHACIHLRAYFQPSTHIQTCFKKTRISHRIQLKFTWMHLCTEHHHKYIQYMHAYSKYLDTHTNTHKHTHTHTEINTSAYVHMQTGKRILFEQNTPAS